MHIKYGQFTKDELLQKIEDLEKENSALNYKLVQKLTGNNSFPDSSAVNNNYLHNKDIAYDFLLRTSDTLLLIDNEGRCVDAIVKTNHRFLKEDQLIGKRMLDILPYSTGQELREEFYLVKKNKITSSRNYDLPLGKQMFYFKCIMQPYGDDYILCQYRDITQRSQMKKRLEISNQKLRETEKVAKIGYWSYDSRTQIVKYAGYVGILTHEELEITVFFDKYLLSVYPDDRKRLRDFMVEEPFAEKRIDYRVIREDSNKPFFIRSQMTKVSQIEGYLLIEGYVQDIDNVIKNRTELETVTYGLNNANDDIFVAHPSGNLIYANYQYRRHNDIPLDADIADYHIQQQSTFTCRAWNSLLNILHKKEYHKYIVTKTMDDINKTIDFDCSSYIIKDQFGKEYVWNFWKNVTAQKLAEESNKYTNQLLNTVLGNIPISVSIKNADDGFKYIYCNKITTKLYKLKHREIVGKTDQNLFSDEQARAFKEEDRILLDTGNTRHYAFQFSDKDGNEYSIDIIKLLLVNEVDNSRLIITLGWDISEIKRIEKELIDAKRKAEESDNLKSAFLSNVSHEIRTPLNAIVGFSRIIAETESADERKYYNGIVESNNNRLLSIVTDILDFSKIEAGIDNFTIGDFDLGGLCKEMQETHARYCTEKQQLIFDNDGQGELWLQSDRNKVYQVLSNLIVNALKFTPAGEVRFGFEVLHDSSSIRIYVSDTGIGIPEDKLEEVFNRFTKLNSSIQGTGLGLTICKLILQKLNGDISVTSVLGEGSTFTFTLPYPARISDI